MTNDPMRQFIRDFERIIGSVPGWSLDEDKEDAIETSFRKRKDYCYDCSTDELYSHAMTFKCSKCHKIILGGV